MHLKFFCFEVYHNTEVYVRHIYHYIQLKDIYKQSPSTNNLVKNIHFYCLFSTRHFWVPNTIHLIAFSQSKKYFFLNFCDEPIFNFLSNSIMYIS